MKTKILLLLFVLGSLFTTTSCFHYDHLYGGQKKENVRQSRGNDRQGDNQRDRGGYNERYRGR